MERLRLTKSEEALMDLFWKEGRPLTSVEILRLSKAHSWSGQYVHKLLKNLESKGLLEVCGQVQYATQYARQFKVVLSSEEVAARSIMSQGFAKSAIAKIAVSLVKETRSLDGDVSNDALVKELEEMLEEYKNSES